MYLSRENNLLFLSWNNSLACCVFVLSFILLLGCENNSTIATVSNSSISQSEFVNRYEDYLIQTGIKDNILTRKEVLNSMITEVLLENCDDNSNIENKPEYQKESKWIEKQAILGLLKDREVYRNLKVSDEEVREGFLRSNQKIAARHLFAKTEQEINEINQLLNIGVDFNTLAKQTFTDSTLKNNGGYLGYFSWGDMEPEFEEKAYSMNVGETSEPVKLKNGYSIIKLEDKITHPLLTENEYINKKEKLAQIIRIRKKKPAEKMFIEEQVNFDEIVFNDDQVELLWSEIELKVKSDYELNLDSKKDFDIVTYKNKSYSTSDIRSRINDIPQYHFEKIESIDRLKIVIKGLILQEHLLILAKEKGYDKSEYVVEKLKGMKTNLLMRYKISEIIENANIEDSTVYSFYKKNQDFFSTHNQINVQEIIVEDLELARELVRKINSGIDFGELSKKYSIRKFSAKNNGILGLLPVSKFGKMQNVFSSSPIGKVIGPIEINDLYGIFKILERTESEIIEFEKARDIATLAVKYKIKNNILRDYVENLKSKNEVNIDLEKLGSTKIFQYN